MERIHSRSPTPLRAVSLGMVASAVGTLVMDAELFRRFKREGGTELFGSWESGATVTDWAKASTPGQVGKRLVEGILQRELPDADARRTNNAVHWFTRLASGALFGIVACTAARPRAWWGGILGSAAWATSCAVLPSTGLYKPINEYDFKTLTDDLTAHLAYGLATGGVFAALTRRRR